MRMSCNGCRVLRKGCDDNCSIRPCLQWINTSDAQANATVFLAKFYGRAGLINLINSGPEQLRPSIFRSLLYEACGRMVNPIYGSVGLLWSGRWHLCQAAVEAVLKGASITTINFEAAITNHGPPFIAGDIRHVSKNASSGEAGGVRCRRRGVTVIDTSCDDVPESASTESSPSSHSARARESKDYESRVSAETAQNSISFPVKRQSNSGHTATNSNMNSISETASIHLELTLGLEPHVIPMKKRRVQ